MQALSSRAHHLTLMVERGFLRFALVLTGLALVVVGLPLALSIVLLPLGVAFAAIGVGVAAWGIRGEVEVGEEPPVRPVIAASNVHTPWDCRWSRVGYRLARVREDEQPESLFVCAHGSALRCPVAPDECVRCRAWEPELRVSVPFSLRLLPH